MLIQICGGLLLKLARTIYMLPLLDKKQYPKILPLQCILRWVLSSLGLFFSFLYALDLVWWTRLMVLLSFFFIFYRTIILEKKVVYVSLWDKSPISWLETSSALHVLQDEWYAKYVRKIYLLDFRKKNKKIGKVHPVVGFFFFPIFVFFHHVPIVITLKELQLDKLFSVETVTRCSSTIVKLLR
jgi:hypothetical protein